MKKRLLKILGISAIAIVLIIGAILAYIVFFLPNIPVPEFTVKADSVNIAHGKYLANHVAVCIDCHSTRDWTKFSGPVTPGTEGKGGDRFDQAVGFPGVFYAKNITPYGLQNWSDGEIFRAITSGVTKDNKVIFPIMPYLAYGKMNISDINDIIAYIRTLNPIKNDVPASDPDFPFSIIMHMIPEKPAPGNIPEHSDTLNYGKYLVNAGSCIDCHTVFEDGKYKMEMAFAGGREFNLPIGILRSANITPHKETGIGSYNTETFINRFKAYDPAKNPLAETGKRDFNSIMPWSMYAGMDEYDLTAVFRYLESLKPISNQVVKFTPLK